MKKMKLKQGCMFDPKTVKHMDDLTSDMNNILFNCKDKNLDSNKYIESVYNYLEKRPNIRNNSNAEDTPLKIFAKQVAMIHLKTHTLYRVLSGQEKNKKIIDKFQDEVKNYKKWSDGLKSEESKLSIESRETGGKVYNSLDKQINATNEIITNMVKQTNMAQA